MLPTPSVACGEVSSLKTLLDTDIASHCSLIDSSPIDKGHVLMEGKVRSIKVDLGEAYERRLHGRMKPEPKSRPFGGDPQICPGFCGEPIGLPHSNFELQPSASALLYPL